MEFMAESSLQDKDFNTYKHLVIACSNALMVLKHLGKEYDLPAGIGGPGTGGEAADITDGIEALKHNDALPTLIAQATKDLQAITDEIVRVSALDSALSTPWQTASTADTSSNWRAVQDGFLKSN